MALEFFEAMRAAEIVLLAVVLKRSSRSIRGYSHAADGIDAAIASVGGLFIIPSHLNFSGLRDSDQCQFNIIRERLYEFEAHIYRAPILVSYFLCAADDNKRSNKYEYSRATSQSRQHERR